MLRQLFDFGFFPLFYSAHVKSTHYGEAHPERNAIAVGTDCSLSSDNETTREYNHSIDQVVMHELSHILWHKLGGSPVHCFAPRGLNTLNEGFALYADSIYFADLYPKEAIHERGEDPFSVELPEGVIKIRDHNLPWDFGERRLLEHTRRIVNNYGEDTFLRIPRNAEEFIRQIGLGII